MQYDVTGGGVMEASVVELSLLVLMQIDLVGCYTVQSVWGQG